MIKAELISKTNKEVIAVFRQTGNDNDTQHYLSGVLSIPYSWHLDLDKTVCDEQFLAEVSIKWDGCSHFRYYGEDYINDKKADSYYHECGLNDYYLQFLSKLFAFEVAKHQMGSNVDMDEDLYIKIERINIMDNYDIKYSKLNTDNDEWYLNYLKIEEVEK